MPGHPWREETTMGKVVHLNFGKEEELVETAHARSSPVRLRILELVSTDKLSIADIARRLQIPASSAALHIRELQEANLVRIEMQPGTRALSSCAQGRWTRSTSG